MRSETMPTVEQIDEQVALERDQIRQGLKRLTDQTIKLEEQEYASATIYGISSIDTLLPLVVQRIEKTNVINSILETATGWFQKNLELPESNNYKAYLLK